MKSGPSVPCSTSDWFVPITMLTPVRSMSGGTWQSAGSSTCAFATPGIGITVAATTARTADRRSMRDFVMGPPSGVGGTRTVEASDAADNRFRRSHPADWYDGHPMRRHPYAL